MARDFNGSTDNLSHSDSSLLDCPQSASMGCWVYIDAFGVSGDAYLLNIFSDEPNDDSGTAILRLGSQGSAALAQRIGVNFHDGSDHDIENDTDLSTGVWTHIAFTTDGTNIRFYINGALDTTKAYTITPTQKSQAWCVGALNNGGREFDGRIAELFYYGRTLSADEIVREMYRAPVSTTSLKLRLNLFGEQSPEPDVSGNGLPFTVTGATRIDHPPKLALWGPARSFIPGADVVSPIAYKSAGAGNGTETTSAALTCACPATVDANDILIAQVQYTGTTTGPSTPSGWTLLYGPADVGVTVTARHWCFGKLADGSEDGATINFGTAGGTQGRCARIYSFSGYVSGTLADVVPAASFSDIPHNTDPQGPSVTTTVAGALAIALTCQDDNNIEQAIDGATGGTWGGYQNYANSTWGPQGLCLDLHTCTPTADPGTVSGGAVVAANDQSSTIGFEIRPNALGATNYSRTLSDSIAASDGAIRGARAFRQMPSDAVALLDLVARGQTYGRAAQDSLTILDALVTGQVFGRTVQDNAALADNLIARYNLMRGLSDSAPVNDILSAQSHKLRITTDAADMGDSLLTSAQRKRLTTDAAVINDAAQRRVDMFRRLLDEATITDTLQSTVAGILILTRILQDGISIEDAVQRTIKAMRLTQDSLALTDELRRTAYKFRLITDGLSTSDAVLSTMRALRVVPETINTNDAIKRTTLLLRQLLDSLGITDSLTSTITLPGVLVLTRILQDNVDVQELVSRGAKAYRLAHDNVIATDQVARSLARTRIVTDVLTVAESMARFLLASRITTDPVQASDTALRYALLNRLTQDAVTAEDAIGSTIEYFQELIGFVLLSLRGDPIIMTLSDEATAELTFAKSQTILMEMRNL